MRLARSVRLAVLMLLLVAHAPGIIAALNIHAAPTARSAPAPDPRFGVVEALRDPLQATEVGARWERIPFWWKELQPDGPGSWNPFATGNDRGINAELAAGRSIAGLLINTPDWAALTPSLHGASVPKGLSLPYDDPGNYWGHFVGLIAKRYAGRIDDWIIWNEVNIPGGHWHTWAGSRADYARLVEVAYLAAKMANPNARIVLFGDPYWYDRGAWFTDLLARLTHAPGAAQHHDYFDVANLHLYNGTKRLATIIRQYRSWLAAAGTPRPLWVSETNCIPYDDPVRRYPKAGFFGTMRDQASFIVQAFAIYLALGIERIEVNRMIDGTDFKAGGEPFGLARNDHTVRPAFYAFRTVSALFSGITGGSIAGDIYTPTYVVTLRKPGATITVAWSQNPVPASVGVPARGSGATLYDTAGHATQLAPAGGQYTLHLSAATDNSDGADPSDYVIGGSPQILVQPS